MKEVSEERMPKGGFAVLQDSWIILSYAAVESA
jgi:hypothetical protein